MPDQHQSELSEPTVTRMSWGIGPDTTRIYIKFLLGNHYQYVTVSEAQAKGMLDQLTKLFQSTPSTETVMSTIGDNSKTPYIDHVTKTRARDKNA